MSERGIRSTLRSCSRALAVASALSVIGLERLPLDSPFFNSLSFVSRALIFRLLTRTAVVLINIILRPPIVSISLLFGILLALFLTALVRVVALLALFILHREASFQ